MSFQDPIADMATRIRNAQARRIPHVDVHRSNVCENIAHVLKASGFIQAVEVEERMIRLTLSYQEPIQGQLPQPVIQTIRRVSKPSLRDYRGVSRHSKKRLTPTVDRFGVLILTTSQGVMTHHDAIAQGIGGEVLIEVN